MLIYDAIEVKFTSSPFLCWDGLHVCLCRDVRANTTPTDLPVHGEWIEPSHIFVSKCELKLL